MKSNNTKSWSDLVLIAIAGIPILFFYYFLWKTRINIPINDDYSLLYFTNNFSSLNGLVSKINYIINYQHGAYKLIIVNAVFAVQFTLLGYVEFANLSLIGDVAVLLVYFLIIKNFKIQAFNSLVRLLIIMPVSLLLFQLQYASTLNFSMAGIQNISVLIFALATLSLLTHDVRICFIGACFSMLFAVGASGNGFLLIPVGTLLLAERKRWLHIIIWIIFSIVVGLIYFTNYQLSLPSINHEDGQLIKILSEFNILYILAFIGSSIAKYQNHLPSAGLGIILIFIWCFAFRNNYSTKNPSVFYFFIFLVLTAIGVSMIRSNLGIEQSLSSRYRIYSNLILILTYIYLIETYFEKIKNEKIQLTIIGISIFVSAIFFVLSNAAGYRFLQGRKIAVTHEMMIWKSEVLHEKIELSGINESQFDPAVTRQLELGIYKPVTPILLESIRLGVYVPSGYSK